MNMITDRNYREYDSRGYAILYNVGDVVIYEGKRYECLAIHKNKQPKTNGFYWRQLTGSYDEFHYSDTVPISANVGDRWIDSSTGKLYTYIEDTTGFHWVEF